MSDPGAARVSRELFLAAIGGKLKVDPWVTDRLTKILEEQEVLPGECVFTAGDLPDHFYFVRQGRLELLRTGKSAETLEGPRALGMLDALLERPRSLSAYAETPLQLVRIRFDAWLELLEDTFELARLSVRGLGRAVAALEQQLWASGRHLTSPPAPVFEPTAARLDIVGRLAVLMCTPLLRGAGVQPVTDLATAADEITFAAGERLFEHGAPRDRVFVQIDGRVEAIREGPHVVWHGGPGQMVCGAVSLIEGSSDWGARAETRTRTLAFRVDDWFDVLEENFEMVRATLVALATEYERLALELDFSLPTEIAS